MNCVGRDLRMGHTSGMSEDGPNAQGTVASCVGSACQFLPDFFFLHEDNVFFIFREEEKRNLGDFTLEIRRINC